MIISHEHKFIFLKTRKTAGTSIELALSGLCGPDDIITPISPNDEPLRANGRRPAELAHAWLVAESASAASALLVSGLCRRLRLLQSHAGGGSARAAQRRQGVAELFQVHLRAQSVGPAGLRLSFPLSPHRQPAAFSRYLHRKRRAWINNFEIYRSTASRASISSASFESLSADFRKALKEIGLEFRSGPAARQGEFPAQQEDIIATITTMRPAAWSANGTRRKSACSLTSSSAS